jgi:hypothetical protein
MEKQVQQFVTLRIGSLWFDVPIGPLVTLLSQSSLRSMAQSSTEQDQEKASMEGCTCLLSRAKQNMGYTENTSAFGIVNPTPTPYMIQKAIKWGNHPTSSPRTRFVAQY